MNQIKNSGIHYFVRLWPSYRIFPHSSFMYCLIKNAGLSNNWTRNYLLNYEAIEGELNRDYIVLERIDFDKTQLQFKYSNVVLDLPYKAQTGFTHSFINAMATGKKVITTAGRFKF
jgi:hypothetical protein